MLYVDFSVFTRKPADEPVCRMRSKIKPLFKKPLFKKPLFKKWRQDSGYYQVRRKERIANSAEAEFVCF